MGNQIKQNCIIPSAAFTVPRSKIKYFQMMDKAPEEGDLLYCEVVYMGQHRHIESQAARLHTVNDGTRAVMVVGNRYAPDYYEGFIPETIGDVTDMLARSGLVGKTNCKNATIGDPTRIKVLGYVCNSTGEVINTKQFQKIKPKTTVKNTKRAKMILCIGTAMNSGKSMAAAACCHALSSMGKNVRASKVTGTASLKDILLMEDCGACHIADFTYLGYPSTYMLGLEDLLHIFNTLDLKYANNPKRYWVVELADGILQRETAMLLENPEFCSRIHKTVFCSHDAFGAIGGIDVLKNKFGITPDALSGYCSSSPLAIRELKEFTSLPIFNSINRDFKHIYGLIK